MTHRICPKCYLWGQELTILVQLCKNLHLRKIQPYQRSVYFSRSTSTVPHEISWVTQDGCICLSNLTTVDCQLSAPWRLTGGSSFCFIFPAGIVYQTKQKWSLIVGYNIFSLIVCAYKIKQITTENPKHMKIKMATPWRLSIALKCTHYSWSLHNTGEKLKFRSYNGNCHWIVREIRKKNLI